MIGFDVSRLPPSLSSLSFLVGRWRSEHGGKAIFPTIPKFTYGEEISFSIPSDDLDGTKGLNYTLVLFVPLTLDSIHSSIESGTKWSSTLLHSLFSAFAWSIGERDELHSEHGYLAVKPNTREVALTTVMNNGDSSLYPFIIPFLRFCNYRGRIHQRTIN